MEALDLGLEGLQRQAAAQHIQVAPARTSNTKTSPTSPDTRSTQDDPHFIFSPSGETSSLSSSLPSPNPHLSLARECRVALRWLRHTGFPLYVQLYNNRQFPIVIDADKLAEDHEWLQHYPVALNTLLDRLKVLNQCAMAQVICSQEDDESEEDTLDVQSIRQELKFDLQSRSNGIINPALEEFEEEQRDDTGRRKAPLPHPKVKLGRANRVTSRPKGSFSMTLVRQYSALTSDDESANPTSIHDTMPCLEENKEDVEQSEPVEVIVRSASERVIEVQEDADGSSIYYSEPSEVHIVTHNESTTVEEEEEDEEDEELFDGPPRYLSSSEPETMRVNRRHRWHSFSHRNANGSTEISPPTKPGPNNLISYLSVTRMQMVRRMSLLKLTSQLECYITPHLTKSKKQKVINNLDYSRKKTYDYDRTSTLFGVPLDLLTKLNGHPLPQQIMAALDYIVSNGAETEGVFRVAGSTKRIKELKRKASTAEEAMSYDGVPIQDVASLVKEYFRDIPGRLFTSRMTEAAVLTCVFMPEELQMQALQHLMLLLPDENRETVFCILGFLHTVSQWSAKTKMDIHNLAVVFAPTLFAIMSPSELPSNGHTSPPNSRKLKGNKKKADYDENAIAISALALMITNIDDLHRVPLDTLMISLHSSSNPLDFTETAHINDIGKDLDGVGDYVSYVEFCMQGMMKEHNSGYKNGWLPVSTPHSCEVSRKKVRDGHQLQLWRGVTEVPASPKDIQQRILRERSMWDDQLVTATTLEELDDRTEVYQYVCATTPSQPNRESVVLRSWLNRDDINIIMATSVRHPKASRGTGVVITELATRYVVESLGPSLSRLTLIVRHDLCGRSVNFYKSHGPWCVSQVCRIRNSFISQSAR